MFINEIVLEENKTFIITAPNGFGKTTNLKLLQSFLETEVDEKGVRKTKVHQNTSITDTSNYYMFVNNSFRITECRDVMNCYFGKYPVISLSFECFSVISELDDAVRLYKRAVHSAYKDHEYLSRSERLSANERKLVRFWSDDHNYHSMTRHQVMTGVAELARLVGRHHGAGAWVLLDDYDAAVRAALEEAVTGDVLRRVVRLTCRLVSHACGGDNVRGCVVTGVLPLSPVTGRTQLFTFLDDHHLGDYFGLTTAEVEKTLGDVEGKHTRMEEIKNKYGYRSESGREIYKYKIIGILKQDGSLGKLQPTNELIDYINVSKPQLKEKMERLLKGESVSLNRTGEFTADDLEELRSVLKGDATTTSRTCDLLLAYLLHLGHLRLTPKGREEAATADRVWVVVAYD